jgi:hypothetical protein
VKTCSKIGCSETAAKAVGLSYYCWYHLKSRNMRHRAKARGKKVPSYDEVDKMFSELVDMKCPICKRTMVLHRSLGATPSVVSLQHDNDGMIRLICHSCNAAHARIGDIIYQIPKEHKQCGQCRTIKPITCFSKARRTRDGHNSKCRQCCSDYQKNRLEDIKKDPEKYANHLRKRRWSCWKYQGKLTEDAERHQEHLKRRRDASGKTTQRRGIRDLEQLNAVD